MKRFVPTALALLLLLGLFMPGAAHAQLDIDVCAPGFMPWAYTSKIVYCIEGMVVVATNSMVVAISNYMRQTVGAMMVISVIVFGMRIMSGERDLVRKGVFFTLRLGLVWLYSYALGGLTGTIFDILDGAVASVSGGYSPWYQIDTFLGRIIGFGMNLSIDQGLLGIVGAAVFSGIGGGMMAMIGGWAILKLLLFIYRVMFIYLTALVGVGFLIVISPLIIPTAIFFYTERYFKRWLDMLIATMLVPVLLFATLSMFVNGFSIMIEDIFAIMGSNPANTNLSSFQKSNVPAAAWLMPSDPQLATNLENVTRNFGKNVPAVSPASNPLLRHAHNLSLFNFPGVDFGPNDAAIKQSLVYAFLTLLLYTMLIHEMLWKIPEIAKSIAGATAAVLTDPSGFEQNVMKAFNKVNPTSGGGGGGGMPAGTTPTQPNGAPRPAMGPNPMRTPRGGRGG